MSLPVSEPVPDDDPPRSTVHRRRGRRPVIPIENEKKAAFFETFIRKTAVSFDFFLFSLLAGVIIAGGILLDSPILFFLGALAAPFMGPLVGLSLSSVTGSGWFFLQTLAGTLVGAGLVFSTGALAGLGSLLLPDLNIPELTTNQAAIHSQITLIDFIVLSIMVIIFVVAMARSDNKPLLPSVILAYELYLPAAVAGFSLCINLTGGNSTLWPASMITFIFYLAWTVFLGIITLWILGIRPLNFFGYIFGALVLIIAVFVGAFTISLNFFGFDFLYSHTIFKTPTIPIVATTEKPLPSATTTPIPPTLTLSPTEAATPTTTLTPTNTLVPSNTPTVTLTPEPTPVWAIVRANNGAFVREAPDATAKVIDGVLGGSLVQVLPDTAQSGGVTWAHIITGNGITGWIVQSILVTATPAPTW